MADSVAKGQEFYDKAQKKLKSFSFFGELRGRCSVVGCMLPQQAGRTRPSSSGKPADQM